MSAPALIRKQFTVAEYHQMYASAILGEDDRVELLDGEIYEMSPLGPLHILLINRLTKLLIHLVGDAAVVSVQNAIQLDDYTEPQPDLAIVHPRVDTYYDTLAGPADVFVVIEIADSSLYVDRTVKLPRYATAQIPEVWIIDVQAQIIEQHTHPVGDQYTRVLRCLRGYEIQSAQLPQIVFTTDQVFRGA